MHKTSNRPERVAELLRREVAQLIAREVHDEAVRGVTITDVDVSRDLKNARVYFSVLAGKAGADVVARALNRAAGFLRHELKHRLALRSIPELRFYFDESLERGARIDRLIDEALRRDRGGSG
jgi:ribosome-binding factor A